MGKKIKFGFKNAYYATITETGGKITYGTPVKIPGAVSMTLAAAGEDVEFYADDSLYFGESVNNGYDGSIEFALIPEEFRKEILGEVLDNGNVMIEKATAIAKQFALLCEFTTDDGSKKLVFYNCIAKRPEVSGETKGANKTISTETLELKIRPRTDGIVKASTSDTTTDEVKKAWYTKVYEPQETTEG